ncbi:glycoside hydrolase family 9 protein [Niabella yanshanensis]|uniref:Glycoside hydrolase family 9 protein n=1 Tax=Niabella yanshanensis TaxID=577386 RepID=A0ABZ0W6H2_9BACT|nr:glycoside hydrolase family 9 protein [Niabella yanshanensis]WQD38870.1 glycoside hydrolase family 9 protein [Niabella yanshanensis]
MKKWLVFFATYLFCFHNFGANAGTIEIFINQVAYEQNGYKTGIIKTGSPVKSRTHFELLEKSSRKLVFSGLLPASEQVKDWSVNDWYTVADFSAFKTPGTYCLVVRLDGNVDSSCHFSIQRNALPAIGIPAILQFFQGQRANSPEELGADRHVLLYGSDKRVDLRGGWCDASGDVSKYFSHLAYTNFMLPQQIPMVTWSFINTAEQLPDFIQKAGIEDAFKDEALYGADYLLQSLAEEGYFYMTLFSYFKKDPEERRVVGLLADSKTTSDYQCAWREGAGMAIAALARISRWNKNRDYTSAQYLAGAERAFAHVAVNNLKYADDGKDNIIDDYCALMASSELWMATGKPIYQAEARQRAANLNKRLSPTGYFIADDKNRPFWHAADAGLPVVALVRYLDIENDANLRNRALATIKRAVDYNLKVTEATVNPFGYARQHFSSGGVVRSGFFIPHDNESGWWWQGEDARLASLTAAMIAGGRLVYPANNEWGAQAEIVKYAFNQVSWILGKNPYGMCMMYGYGHKNVPYMASMYGHGSGKGGISNGITGKDGNADGTGIDFKVADNGNEWRWSEQWIPHTGWFLQAVTALAPREK